MFEWFTVIVNNMRANVIVLMYDDHDMYDLCSSRLGSWDPVTDGVKYRPHGDEVGDSFLVELQNQGRAGTTWGPSHEWRLAGDHTKFVGFLVVHHKTTRFLG
jgi:hypothetical protein